MNPLPQSVVFVVNPAAGGGRIGPLVTAVTRRLRQAGGQVHVLATGGPGEATGIARRAVGTADLVVAVGGDGTAREVAEGCRGSGTPIAILPAGTENILGKYFGYAATVESLWRCISQGVGRSFDMGRVNGQPFLIVAGAGFDAEVVRQLSLARKGHIDRMAYALPLWRTFWEYRFDPISVAVDGETVFAGRGIVLVGNIHRYCLDLRILRDARDDDGLLDVCIFPCRWQGGLMVHSLFTALRRHVERRSVIYRQGRHIRIDSAVPLPLEVDGDVAGTLPAEFTIDPGAVTFRVPPQANRYQ